MLSRTDGQPFRSPSGGAYDHIMLEAHIGARGVRFDYSAAHATGIETGGITDLNAYMRSLR